MHITRKSSPQDFLIFYAGAALFCCLIVVVSFLAYRSQIVDDNATDVVREWLTRKNNGAPVVVINFSHKPGFKGKAVRVEYTVHGKKAKKSPRYLLIRRALTGPWTIAYEIDEQQYLHGPNS